MAREIIDLTAEVRTGTGKGAARQARRDGLVPGIIYGDGVEHLSAPLRVMRDLNRHLAPGAVIIVSVPNVAHLSVRLSLLVGRFQYGDRGILDRTHLSFFTRRTFRSRARSSSMWITKHRSSPRHASACWPEIGQGAGVGVLIYTSCHVVFACGAQPSAISRQLETECGPG